ncbi:TPA: hypothetical protein ACXKAZ_000324 [Pseudomonas aeruginosa]|uniref:hypothetical protein n=1 Tax=Pseudomonas aeruginosa TaxID=287 RepID=UPI00114F57B2|nr:hypothetical protein [Pseudomonas aeruginosa]EJV1460574.1 hypothetical protein [Pseudomonas aeruginosa]MBF3053372.1 hypothetical protein [Pseudomonas aeruginosa]MDC9031434.1 hypothetical protein [Pseudomonas aeruginosa]QTB74426.1 hypothetical protein LYSZa5_29685 [Pseudomonas aeruginosa]QTB86566.1 hypothetical protein LYSZa2_29685 [Pseudomonas aeruginosa]
MTVQPISDEQLAEVERLISQREPSYENRKIMNATISAIIARLRAAEVDAKRYRWLRDSGRLLGDNMDSHEYNFCVVTADGEDVMWFEQLDSAIDAAMESTP